MSLLRELTEPFFQYVCRLNRVARAGGKSIDRETVRSDLLTVMDEMKQTASQRPEVAEQYAKVRMPLVFFADFMIKEGPLPFAREWRELAKDEGEHAGDEKFFDLLEETLEEQGRAADERLLIFYECLGLGFTGYYTGQPEQVRTFMRQLSARVRSFIDLDDTVQVTPEAYENVDTSDLVEPPGKKMVGIGIVLLGLTIVTFAANIAFYIVASGDLKDAVNNVVERLEGDGDSGDDGEREDG